MNPLLRLLLLPVALTVLIAAAAAQDPTEKFSTDNVFTFATTPGGDLVDNPDKDLKAAPNLEIRPNHDGEYFLYAKNPFEAEKSYVVELRGLPGSGLRSQAKVTIPGKKWARVRLAKPAPPAPAPGAPPAAVPAAAAPAVPPPPGSELVPSAKGPFQFTLRLLNENFTPVLDDETKLAYGRVIEVRVLRPKDYILPPDGTITRTNRITRATVQVSPMLKDGQPAFTGTADLRLSFPPQSALTGAIVREGIYRRTLVVDPTDKKAALATLEGVVENAGEKLRIDIGVDGIERAFIYEPDPTGDIKGGKLIRMMDPAIRIFPAVGYKTDIVTQPVPAFPVRVEVDNAPAEAKVQILIRPRGAKEESLNEVVRLGGAFDDRLWLDVSGPADEGILLTSRVKDWTKSLDLAALRGMIEVVAVLTVPQGTAPIVSSPLNLMVDATPPEEITIVEMRLPDRLVKGKPLPVEATVTDPETKVVKALFFLGTPQDDGKLPANAIVAEGHMVKDNPGHWAATLPLPPDKRGPDIVGVVFTNEVGLAATGTKRIELIDAPAPTPPPKGPLLGAIDGVVKAGELPAGGTLVNLFDADGKLKNTAKADTRGKFKMEDVVPGTYILKAGKETSSYPLEAATPVQVEPEKRSQASMSMIKNAKTAK